MAVEKKTNYGNISVSEEAVASLAGGVIDRILWCCWYGQQTNFKRWLG